MEGMEGIGVGTEATRNDNGELNSPVPAGPEMCEVCHLAMGTEHIITRGTKPPGQIPCVEVRNVCKRCYMGLGFMRMTPRDATLRSLQWKEWLAWIEGSFRQTTARDV